MLDLSFGGILDLIYRAIQLFFVEFDRGCSDGVSRTVHPVLQLARFLAILLLSATIASLLLPRAFQSFRLLVQSLFPQQRIVLLGYGSVGQAIAERLAGNNGFLQGGLRTKRRLITAVHSGVSRDLIEHAGRNGVVLVEGDPSDTRVHRRIRIKAARSVFVATASDLATIDAAVAAALDAPRGTVCAILADSELSTTLSETAARGFLGASDVVTYSLTQEAARLLIAEARFDRTAIELGQKHAHVFIVGAGAMGEAIATEILLTAWRTGLGPPAISFLDINATSARMRISRKAPALFGDVELPEAARADVWFNEFDVTSADFVTHKAVCSRIEQAGPASGWVFATGDDQQNLRAASHLHQMMLARSSAPSPIYIRILAGRQTDTPVVAAHPVSLAKAFGSLRRTIAESPVVDDDPDAQAKKLHSAYLAAGRVMARDDPSFAFTGAPWASLPTTLQNANRQLYRHAPMKIEDLGGQWRSSGRSIPVADSKIREAFLSIERGMNYGVADVGPLPARWWVNGRLDVDVASPDGELQRMRAERLKNVAIEEHNRWMMSRALDGWIPAASTDRRLRDDDRRIHNNMRAWNELDASTRRYDAVMLRALIEGGNDKQARTAWPRKVSRILLAIRSPVPTKVDALAEFTSRCRLIRLDRDEGWSGITELQVYIGGEPAANELVEVEQDAARLFSALLADRQITHRLCRVRFDFLAPPLPGAMRIANAIGAVAKRWRDPLKVSVDGRELEVSSLWRWGERRLPVAGFIGHRDLGRVGGPEGLAEFLETVWAERYVSGQIGCLVGGYAPGSDRVAMNTWIGIGQKPKLIFPTLLRRGDTIVGNSVFATDVDPIVDAIDEVPGSALQGFAEMRTIGVTMTRTAHEAQADELVGEVDLILAIYDGNGSSGPGSVGDTISKAVKNGKAVEVIDRDRNGLWQIRPLIHIAK